MIPSWTIRTIDECDSTNSVLRKELLAGTASRDTLLIAKKQTVGYGRMGRVWAAPAGNLSMSLAVPLPEKFSEAYQINLLAAHALAGTIFSLLKINAGVKWPNDVQINGAKVAGILSEALPESHAAIVGIGLNLNSIKADFPRELHDIITTLRDEAGHVIDSEKFLKVFLSRLGEDLDLYFQKGLSPFLDAIRARLVWRGENVTVQENAEKQFLAKIVSVAADGSLELLLPNGENRNILSGEIHVTRT